jgi:O-antigen biosynthesis protein WbqP
MKSKKSYMKIKRIGDFILSLFGMILLLPVFLILMIAIKIDSPGPVFLSKNVWEYIKRILIF